MTFRLSAGVYYQEFQRASGIFNSDNATIGCSTFYSKKGPLGPHLVTGGYEEFCNTYGYQTPLNATLKPALEMMNTFYGNRVVNQARYAGLSVYYDKVNAKMFTSPFATGTLGNYETAQRTSKLLDFSTYLTANDSITLDVGETNISQPFNQTSNNTLTLLATQIKNTLGEGANARVIKTWNFSDRKTEILVTFNRVFEINDIVKFTISGDNNITPVNVDLTYDSGNVQDFLDSIATAINTSTQITATAVPLEADALPSLIITCLSAGPYQLKVTDDVGMTTELETSYVVQREGHGVFDDRVILIDLPETMEDIEISGEITSTPAVVPAKTITVDSNAKIFDVFAENPGEWASSSTEGLGIKITNLDEGIRQRTRITMSQAIAAGNTFTCQIGYNGNTWTTNPVVFSVSSDNTMQLIAKEIQNTLDNSLGKGGQAIVEEVPNGDENDRSILIIMPNPSQVVEITDALFTGGQAQPIANVSQVIPNTPSTETFTLQLFNQENLRAPIEQWNVSLNNNLDGNGNQQNIAIVVNSSASRSSNIRIVQYSKNFSILQTLDTINWLGGGDDGYAVTTSQLINGWNLFADPETTTVRILINAGYTNVSIQQRMAFIAEKRRDCFAILDMPSDKQAAQEAYNYRQYELNVNTSYAAIYSSDILVYDDISGEDIYIAPSGYVAAVMCYTILNSYLWFAPAGLNRGILSNAKGVRFNYNEGERDLIEPVHINPILDKKANGIVVFGEFTTQVKEGPLKEVHVRLLCNNIYISLTDAMQYKLFEPNDEYVRTVMVKEISDYLEPIKQARGLRDYAVASDITKEAAADVDAGVGYVKILIKPVSSLKYIMLQAYVLGSGVSFDEVISNGV